MLGSIVLLATVLQGSLGIHFLIVMPSNPALNAHLTLNAHKTKHASMKDVSILASLTTPVLHKLVAPPELIIQYALVRKNMVETHTDSVTDRNVELIMTVLSTVPVSMKTA